MGARVRWGMVTMGHGYDGARVRLDCTLSLTPGRCGLGQADAVGEFRGHVLVHRCNGEQSQKWVCAFVRLCVRLCVK